MDKNQALQSAKQRVWFYEFELPDGSRTRTDIPAEISHIHTSRRDKLRKVLERKVPNAAELTAIDFASHEGYFALELARHFRTVLGLEFRNESIEASRLMTDLLGVTNLSFRQADLQRMEYDPTLQADFVLIYGLIYHLENPIHVLRLASALARRHVLIETQVFPYDLSGRIENGHFMSQREAHGVFSLSADASETREGGSTDLALVPSLNALLFILRRLGFPEIEVIRPDTDDYEQFRRGSRVIIYAGR
jgi:tRNA (mo5U34)-methyltransferase